MIRVALIGYGLAGRVFHAPHIGITPGLRLDAVVTGDPERQARLRRDVPDARIIERVEQLWDDAASYDLVVIGAPNGTHVPLALAALGAGLHVVVDKPFASTAAEGQRVLDEANRRDRLVIPFHNRRWDGDMLTVQKLLHDGEFGDVYRFESRFERWRGAPKPRWCAPTAEARANAEGILHDIGPHLVDQALVLFGPVRQVYAELDRRMTGVTTDDDATLLLTHASGVRSRLVASAVSAQSGPRFAVYGSRAGFVKFGLDPQEATLAAGGGPPGGPHWGEEPESRWGVLGLGEERRTVPTVPGNYAAFYAGVAAAIRNGAPPPVTAEDAIAGLVVMDAAIRSDAERRAIDIA